MQKQLKRYRGFITHSRTDEAKARRLHKALERYRVPRGIAFEGLDKDRKLGAFFRDSDAMQAGSSLGEALKGALADADCLIAICSPQAAASDWVEREIVHYKKTSEPGPVLAVIVRGKPNVSASPNTRKAARECLPTALKPPAENLRKESVARTRARIAAAVLDISFDDLWRRDRGRAWAKRLIFGTGAICVAGVVAFGALAVTGLALRQINANAQVTSTVQAGENADAATATRVACEASVESVSAWDAAVQTGMRAKEYREMERMGAGFKEAMFVCAAIAGHKPTEQNARALCDRLNDVVTPDTPANATDSYSDAIAMMSEQLQAAKASCAHRLARTGVNRSSPPSGPAPPESAGAAR